MREYQAQSGARPHRIRAVVGGKVNSGKTHFAATAPKPLFLSDSAEGGAETLEHMDPSLWWDPDVRPAVWDIENMMDIPQAITKLLAMSMKAKLPWDTLVIDSISIFARRILGELAAANPSGNNLQRYGELNNAVQALVTRAHMLPMHVIWLCHISDEGDLAVAGKATAAVWAYMNYKWLCNVETMNKAPDFQLRTRPFQRCTWLGGRGGINQFPDPCIPSFKYIAAILGLLEQPASPACPTFGGVDYSGGFVL